MTTVVSGMDYIPLMVASKFAQEPLKSSTISNVTKSLTHRA